MARKKKRTSGRVGRSSLSGPRIPPPAPTLTANPVINLHFDGISNPYYSAANGIRQNAAMHTMGANLRNAYSQTSFFDAEMHANIAQSVGVQTMPWVPHANTASTGTDPMRPTTASTGTDAPLRRRPALVDTPVSEHTMPAQDPFVNFVQRQFEGIGVLKVPSHIDEAYSDQRQRDMNDQSELHERKTKDVRTNHTHRYNLLSQDYENLQRELREARAAPRPSKAEDGAHEEVRMEDPFVAEMAQRHNLKRPTAIDHHDSKTPPEKFSVVHEVPKRVPDHSSHYRYGTPPRKMNDQVERHF